MILQLHQLYSIATLKCYKQNLDWLKKFKFNNRLWLYKGLQIEIFKQEKNINHFFGEYNKNLELENFNSSNLSLNFEKISSDTYLKVFESNIANTRLKPENPDKLKNELELNLNHNKFDFNAGIQAFEDLQKKIVIDISMFFRIIITALYFRIIFLMDFYHLAQMVIMN